MVGPVASAPGEYLNDVVIMSASGRLQKFTRHLNERLLTMRPAAQTQSFRFRPPNGCFTLHSRRSIILL